MLCGWLPIERPREADAQVDMGGLVDVRAKESVDQRVCVESLPSVLAWEASVEEVLVRCSDLSERERGLLPSFKQREHATMPRRSSFMA